MENLGNFIAPKNVHIIQNWRPYFWFDQFEREITQIEIVSPKWWILEVPVDSIDMKNLTAIVTPNTSIRFSKNLDSSSPDFDDILWFWTITPSEPIVIHLGKMEQNHYNHLTWGLSNDLRKSIPKEILSILDIGWTHPQAIIPQTISTKTPQEPITITPRNPNKGKNPRAA